MSLPFRAVCHPDIDKIEKRAVEWLAQFAEPRMVAHVARARPGRIVARTVHFEASDDLINAYARFLSWGFWFDDVFIDDVPADDPTSIPAVCSILDILDFRRPSGFAGTQMEAAFTEVVNSLRRVLLPEQWARWADQMRLWFASMVMQNAMRIDGTPPAAAVYRTMRRYSVCSIPCIVLIDASAGAVVDWNTFWDADMTVLRLRAAKVVAWHNDVFSYHAERKHPGSFWNLPAIYVAADATPEEALRRTANEAAEEAAEFVRHRDEISPRMTKAQRVHVQSLENWMSGCRDWSLEATARYVGWRES
ncbi:terpene synthase family protein [Lentzea roselyniae]